MAEETFNDIAAGLRDAIAHARGDQAKGEASRVRRLDIAAIRAKLGMTQAQFAATFGVSVGTIRNWEQGRRAPRGPARVLLLVIESDPAAVQRALEAA